MPANSNYVQNLNTGVDNNGAQLTYQQELISNQYSAAVTGKTFGTALSATVATLGLYNPTGNGGAANFNNIPSTAVQCVIKSCQIGLTAAAGAPVTIYYAVTTTPGANPTGVTPVTIFPCRLSNPITPQGIAFTVATLNAVPTALRVHQSIISTAFLTQSIFDDTPQGKIIVPPGCALAMQAITAAGGAVGSISIVWEEIPYWQ